MLLLLLLVLAIAAALIFHSLGYFLWPWETRTRMVVGNGNIEAGTLQDMSEEEMAEYLQREVDASRVRLHINSRPKFADGSSEGSLYIENDVTCAYDMTVDIYLGADNTGQLVYESGIVPPGYYIRYDKLNVVLSQGEYEATAYVSYYDGDTLVTMASASLTLVIQN